MCPELRGFKIQDAMLLRGGIAAANQHPGQGFPAMQCRGLQAAQRGAARVGHSNWISGRSAAAATADYAA